MGDSLMTTGSAIVTTRPTFVSLLFARIPSHVDLESFPRPSSHLDLFGTFDRVGSVFMAALIGAFTLLMK